MSEKNIIKIHTVEDFITAIKLNKFKDSNNYIILNNDICFDSYEDLNSLSSSIIELNCTFDGNNHCLKNLLYSADNNNSLFGKITTNGVIKNLTISDYCIYLFNNCGGGFAYRNYGVISNCSIINAVISIDDDIKCLNDFDSEYEGIGGFVGINFGNIEYCKIKETNITGFNNVGSIAGINFGNIDNCVIEKCNILESWDFIGSICGCNLYPGKITNCESDCDIYYCSEYIGGLVGDNSSIISNCKLTRCIIENCRDNIDYLVYKNSDTIENCNYNCDIVFNKKYNIGKDILIGRGNYINCEGNGKIINSEIK